MQLRLTPRALEVLRYFLQGLLNKEIAFALDISEGTVKNHLRDIYAQVGAAHGRTAMSHLYRHARIASIRIYSDDGADVLIWPEDIMEIAERVAPGQDNWSNEYIIMPRDFDDLRRGSMTDPLTNFVRYHDSLGDAPTENDFDPMKMRLFGKDTADYHWLADIALAPKDYDYRKFKFFRGGPAQPTISGGERRDLCLGDSPFRPMRDDVGGRLLVMAHTGKPTYQQCYLSVPTGTWHYRCVTLPLYDNKGTCTHGVTAFETVPITPETVTHL